MPNALAGEKSPYLLQHAANPVDWMPWGEPAFARAKAEQKPIFLSIGYATCHWCHVMARESFEAAEVAARLNEAFVSIKVDREERSDVDRVYMTYVQAMTGQGGWPLSVWLTPDRKPFFGGTYFPRGDQAGRPGFLSLLEAIAQAWTNDRARLIAEGDRVIDALRAHLGPPAGTQGRGAAAGAEPPDEPELTEPARAAYERCFQHLYESFDPNHGGFGGAPKFPRAANLDFLFRVAALAGPASETGGEAINLAAATCRAMAQGGIHDHVGGGFHRYAVDEGWFVPHFEKMLYDQAQIALNLLEARQATGDERFGWVARDTLDYVLRDLCSPGGAFYSAEDADSAEPDSGAATDAGTTPDPARHAEGAFYLWRSAELTHALGADAALFCTHFGITEDGNVPAQLDRFGEFKGKNILAQKQPLATTAARLGIDLGAASERLRDCLVRLREVRARRPRPLRDDKIITAWNGLMLSALARAHAVLEPEVPGGYLEAAGRAAGFLHRELYDADRNVLYRSWRLGRGATEGFAEDYAFLVAGLLDLYEAGFELCWLQWAERLQQAMDERFWDSERGGYFNSAADDPTIVLRLKEDYDGAEPAPSSVAALNLLRLASLLDPEGKAGLRRRGLRCLAAFQSRWSAMPQAMPAMLCAFEPAVGEPRQIVFAGDPRSPALGALAAVRHERLRPRAVVLAADGGVAQQWLAQRAPWLAAMAPRDGQPLAYVCENFACQSPVATPDDLRRILGD